MSDLYPKPLAHSKWDCKYHVVFVPKRRRKVTFGKTRQQLGANFHALAKQKECQIVEGHLMSDHVHICIAIPPKHPVASVIGFLKGKSAIAIARRCGRERNFSGEDVYKRQVLVFFLGESLLDLLQIHGKIRRRLGPRTVERRCGHPPAPSRCV